MAIAEIFGVKIEKNAPRSRLDELGVTTWTKWECGQSSKIPWTYPANEKTYVVEGKIQVYVDGYEGCIELGGGDLISFPKGTKIVWQVTEPVKKYYKYEESSDANNPLTSYPYENTAAVNLSVAAN